MPYGPDISGVEIGKRGRRLQMQRRERHPGERSKN
jgi:hypothetical protein